MMAAISNNQTNSLEDYDTVSYNKLRLEFTTPIGCGAYGTVYKAFHQDWGCLVAYKKLNTWPQVILKEKCKKNLLKEAKIHRPLRHKNIVSMLGVVLEDGNYGLILEYVVNGALNDFLTSVKERNNEQFGVPWRLKTSIAYDICCGMSYLHTLRLPVIHGDLKISNIVMSEHLVAKVADFGLARWKEFSLSQSGQSSACAVQGTPSHIPPETWKSPDRRPDEFFDVYSAGILLWELFTEKKAFKNYQNLIRLFVIDGIRPPIEKMPRDVPSPIINWIQACWDQKPSSRPSFPYLVLWLHGLLLKNEILADARRVLDIYNGRLEATNQSVPSHVQKMKRAYQPLSDGLRRTDQILAYLWEKRAVTSQEFQRIRSQETVYDWMRFLTDAFSEKTKEEYYCFLNALKFTAQHHLCRVLEEEGCELDVDHRDILIDNYTFLKRNITISGTTILEELHAFGLLDNQEKEEIQAKPTRAAQIEQLIQFMIRTSDEQYQQFLESLNKASNEFVCERLMYYRVVQVENDYEAVRSNELSLRSGDIIRNVIKKEGEWWEGKLDKKKGIFPKRVVKELHRSMSNKFPNSALKSKARQISAPADLGVCKVDEVENEDTDCEDVVDSSTHSSTHSPALTSATSMLCLVTSSSPATSSLVRSNLNRLTSLSETSLPKLVALEEGFGGDSNGNSDLRRLGTNLDSDSNNQTMNYNKFKVISGVAKVMSDTESFFIVAKKSDMSETCAEVACGETVNSPGSSSYITCCPFQDEIIATETNTKYNMNTVMHESSSKDFQKSSETETFRNGKVPFLTTFHDIKSERAARYKILSLKNTITDTDMKELFLDFKEKFGEEALHELERKYSQTTHSQPSSPAILETSATPYAACMHYPPVREDVIVKPMTPTPDTSGTFNGMIQKSEAFNALQNLKGTISESDMRELIADFKSRFGPDALSDKQIDDLLGRLCAKSTDVNSSEPASFEYAAAADLSLGLAEKFMSITYCTDSASCQRYLSLGNMDLNNAVSLYYDSYDQ